MAALGGSVNRLVVTGVLGVSASLMALAGLGFFEATLICLESALCHLTARRLLHTTHVNGEAMWWRLACADSVATVGECNSGLRMRTWFWRLVLEEEISSRREVHPRQKYPCP